MVVLGYVNSEGMCQPDQLHSLIRLCISQTYSTTSKDSASWTYSEGHVQIISVQRLIWVFAVGICLKDILLMYQCVNCLDSR